VGGLRQCGMTAPFVLEGTMKAYLFLGGLLVPSELTAAIAVVMLVWPFSGHLGGISFIFLSWDF
jgi:hypothetical protein